MPHYLIEAAYTGEAWGAQIKNPGNRVEQLRSVVEGLGGSIETAYYTFGDYDIMATISFPDNPSAAAFSLAASSGGGRQRAEDHALDDYGRRYGGHEEGRRRRLPPTRRLKEARTS